MTARPMSVASDSAQEKICTILAALASRKLEALELAKILRVSRRMVYQYLHHLTATRRISVANTLMRHGRVTSVYTLFDEPQVPAPLAAPPKSQQPQKPTRQAVEAVRRQLAVEDRICESQPVRRDWLSVALYGEARA